MFICILNYKVGSEYYTLIYFEKLKGKVVLESA